MKKLVVILFSLVLAVSIVACGHESTDQEELETKAYSWAELETPTEEISNSFSIEVFDKDKKETPYSEENAKYYYEGTPLEFYIKMTNSGTNTIHATFSTLSNADLQKFMLDESDKELLDYKVDIESEGDYVFHVRVNPNEVHKEHWTKISFIANVKFGEELNQSESDYTWQYSLAYIYVYAKEEKHEKVGKKYQYTTTDSTYEDLALQSTQGGLALTDKKEEMEAEGEVKKYQKGKDTLYATMSGDEKVGEDYTALMYIDGRLVKAFQGQYQVKFKAEKGKVYNFKVDDAVIPEGEHSMRVVVFPYSYGKDSEIADTDKYTSMLQAEYIVEVK